MQYRSSARRTNRACRSGSLYSAVARIGSSRVSLSSWTALIARIAASPRLTIARREKEGTRTLCDRPRAGLQAITRASPHLWGFSHPNRAANRTSGSIGRGYGAAAVSTSGESFMSEILARIARTLTQHWKRSLVAAIVVLFLIGAAAGAGGEAADDFEIPGTESQQALDLFRAHSPAFAGADSTIVFAAEDGTLADHRDAIEAALEKVRGLEGVEQVADPFAE